MRKILAIAAALAAFATSAHADLNVFATVPEWGALATELGGDKVKVYTATNALQDPHHVEARPSLIAKMRSADSASRDDAFALRREAMSSAPRSKAPEASAFFCSSSYTSSTMARSGYALLMKNSCVNRSGKECRR